MTVRRRHRSSKAWPRTTRALGFALIAFAMPVLFLTCGNAPAPEQRNILPDWELGEWWEVESTVAVEHPDQGAPLSGLVTRHRFEVVAEETVDAVACWRVEARPVNLRDGNKELGSKKVARLWVSKEGFLPVRIETETGAGPRFLDPPFDLATEAPGKGPALLPNAATILDLPAGPRRADGEAPPSWESSAFERPATGRTIRQTAHEIVERRGRRRERVVNVTLSDGAVTSHQVWRPHRPWPDSQRTWAGGAPDAPFVYRSELKSWSREPFRSHVGVFFLVFGFAAQGLFTARFVVQWLESERAGRSVIPMAFWHCSLAGGIMLLVYAIYRLDPVFILGQSFGSFVYTRNLLLRRREHKDARMAAKGE